MAHRNNFTIFGNFDTDGDFRWTVTSTDEGADLEFKSRSREDIDIAIDEVRTAIDGLGKTLDPMERAGSQDVFNAAAAVARPGRGLAEALFGDDLPALEELLATDALEHISVSTPRGVAQWPIEFCLLHIDGRNVYLGERCVVVRRYPIRAGHRRALDELLPRSGEWRSSYAEDGSLDSSADEHGSPGGAEHELHALAPVVGGAYGKVDFLPSLDPATPAAAQKAFQNWVGNSGDVVHFNSHTVVDKANRYLQVTDNARIGRADFVKNTPLSFTSDAFVFLNACTSAFGKTNWEGSIAVGLAEARAGAIACTTGQVDGRVATAFAKQFYLEFVKPNTTVVRAMLKARRATNKEFGHPLSNLYTLIGDEGFKLRPSDEQ